jgi:hypothetical protein
MTFIVGNQRRPTIHQIGKIHVGLDVHKDRISVAVAEPGRIAGRMVGKVVHDVSKMLKLLGKIGTAEQLHLVHWRALSRRIPCCRHGKSQLSRNGARNIAQCCRIGAGPVWIKPPCRPNDGDHHGDHAVVVENRCGESADSGYGLPNRPCHPA